MRVNANSASPGAKWTLRPDALTRVCNSIVNAASLLRSEKGDVQFACLQKKKAAGQRPFSNAGWSSRGSHPRQGLGGCRRGTLRKHRSGSHAACTLFQSCFVNRGNGFVGGEALFENVGDLASNSGHRTPTAQEEVVPLNS